jgi:cytidylate kinase
MAVITISGEPGAFGEEIAPRLAGHLGFLLVDKIRLAQLWAEADLDEANFWKVDETLPGEVNAISAEAEACARMLPDLIAQLAEEQDLVIIGRGAQGLFHNRPGTLHVQLVAPRKFRVLQVRTHERTSEREARKQIRHREMQRARYLSFMYRLNWKDPSLYDLTLRMDRLTIENALTVIVTAFDEMGLQRVPRNLIVENLLPEVHEKQKSGRFVNDAEREFARFLDFYHIAYEYEPRTFPLEATAEGKIAEAFTPDFYLPDQDLYIELTTMKQSLVTRKNRKVRKLRQLYPEVNIRIFYQRDFNSLLAKFGLLAAQNH